MLSVSVWDGDGSNNLWSNPDNWRGGQVPGANDDLVFQGADLTDTQNDLAAGTSFRSLWFRSSDFSIAGNDLAVTNRITVAPGATGATIAADVALNGTVQVTVAGGPLSLSGVVSGSGGLFENGNGILVLEAGAAYTGNTTIQGGATLQLGCTDALPSGQDAGSVRVNGTLDLGGYSTTVDGLRGRGLVTSGAPGLVTLSVDTTQSSTFSGVIEDGLGTVALTTVGTGALTLNGENTFSGVVTIGEGSTLRLGSADALHSDPEVNGTLDLAGYSTELDGLWGSGTITSSVSGAVTLTINTTNYSGTFSGVIQNGSGTMSVTITGTGTQTLSGTNTYSGTTTVSQGTLQVGDYYSGGTLGSGAVVDNASLVFSCYGTVTFANAISGTGTVTQSDSYGTLILTGSNTYSGGTVVSSGTLQVGSGGTSGTIGTGAVTNNESLVFNRSDTVTVSGAISGSGTLTQQGSGTLVLSGSNTYSGATTVNSGGTLRAGSNGALPSGSGKSDVTLDGTLDLNGYSPSVNGLTGSGTVTAGVSGNATLTVGNNDQSSTFSGVVQDGSGTVSLTKVGTGTLYLTGTNTHSGGTTISAGTLQLGYYGSTGTLGSGAVVNNAALVFNRSGTTTIANAISGSGTVTVEGSGNTVILTGSNTYSGTTTIVPSEDYSNTTLQVGNAGTTGTLGSGTVTSGGYYPGYAQLVFNRSDGVTSSNAITGAVNVTVASGSTLKAGSSSACGLPNGTTGTGSVTISGTFDLNGYSPTVHSLIGTGTVTSGVSGTATLTVLGGGYEEYGYDTFSGVIEDGSGTVALTKVSSDGQTLTGTNTYSGGTTVSAGTLQVGNNTATGTLGSGAVVDNGSLAFKRSGTTTFGNAISGSGTLTQYSGTLILTGGNTYSGTTTIYEEATLQVGNGGTSGTLGTGSVAYADDYNLWSDYSQLVFNRSDGVTSSNAITGAVNVTVAAGSTLKAGSSSACGLPNGTTSTGTVTINGTFDLNGYSPTLHSLTGSGTVTSGVSGTCTVTVLGDGYEGYYYDTFSGVIEDGSGTVALTKVSSSGQTLAGTNTYSGGTTVSAGTLQVGNNTSTGTLGTGGVVNSGSLSFKRSGTATIGNAISGTGTLTQYSGTLVLTGSNTYSGTTTIYEEATLQVGNGGTSGTLGSGAVAYADDYNLWSDYSQLVFNRSDGVTSSNAITGAVNVTVAAGSTLKAGSSSDCGLPNGTTGTGTVTINGTFDLNGYSPTVGKLGGSGTVTSGVAGTATLTLSNTGYYESSTFPGVIEDGSGTVSLTKAGDGGLYLTGANTHSGGTTISGGTLYAGCWGSTGTLGTGAVVDNASLVFCRTDSATFGNAISGTGTVTQSNGTVTLTGANTYSGGTIINMNTTLRVGGTSGTLGSGEVTCVDDYSYNPAGQLVFDRTTDATVSNALTGYLSVVQQGSGEVSLTGSNTYSQGTSIGSGSTLCLGDGGTSGSLGSGTVAVASGGLLAFDRSDSATVGNSISGQGELDQQGPGTIVLIGQVSLGGATVSDGTLQVESSVTLTNALTNEGTLRVVDEGVFTHAGTRISGSAASMSAGEVSLISTGLGTETTTFDFEISTDGVNYYPIATGGETDAQAMLSGLDPDTNYYLRGRATHLDGSQEIYDGGMVTTSDGPGEGVADTSGWYRVSVIRSDSYYGGNLTPASGSTAYVETGELPQGTQEVLLARDPQVLVFGDTGSPPLGSQNIFNLDHSWFFAESPQAAVLRAVVGLVYDQSTPIMLDRTIQVFHITHYVSGYLVADFWTFDEGRYPVGGYSDYWYSDPYTIIFELLGLDTPCDSCNCGTGDEASGTCGLPSDSGSAVVPINAIDDTGGAAACGTGTPGLTYSSREDTLDTGFGPGWSDADELPYLTGGEQNMVARLGAEQTVWFDAQQDGSYTARYGASVTLVHDSENDLFILTGQDGTRCEFFDTDQTAHPQGSLYRWMQPGGKTIEATAWTLVGPEYGQVQRIAEVLYRTTPTGQAHQKREFTYVTTDDGVPHVETVTLSEYSGSAWTNVRKMTYDYYGNGDSYGLPGDLKTIVTEEWDATAEDWIGDDTNYFRYWTENDVQTGAVEHGLKRVLLPNAYAAFVTAYGDPDDPQNQDAGDSQTDPIANYTCFYYEYDADRRVTDRIVFGKTNETEYTSTLSTNSRTPNTWDRKTVETRLDGSTNTVYANYLGQTILTDLYDPASETHTVTYNRYDGDGRLVLTAEASAFVAQSGEYYDEDLPDLIDYAGGDSPYLSDAAGLFQVTTYYASTSEGIDEDTAGGVEGYVYQTALAHGEDSARIEIGESGGPVLQVTYEYYARAVGDVTIYPVASQTVYEDDDGTGAITTTCDYTWYTDSFQIQEQTITLPAVSAGENGSGTSATTKQWFDEHGNLVWSMDELGRATYYEYDSLTGQLAKTIEDIDDATADELALDIPAGWTLPTSGGVNATTDYEYDAFGRVTEILGPAHTADIGGTPTAVRTATWTFYNDATHETRMAQGYAVESTPGVWDDFTIVGPVSITKTDRDGRTTEQIQATYTGDLEDLAAATINQSDYTAWTTYQYQNTRLASSRVYHDIPSSGAGQSGTNYDETTYGYETFGTGKKGRENKIVTPDGTITRVVYDAHGNVLETWIGTNDTGATDADPTGGSAQGNDMTLFSASEFDADGNMVSSADALSRTTEYAYDWRGRLVELTEPDPDGEGELASSVTEYAYDNLNRMVEETDPLGNVTSYGYDVLGRVYRVTEPDPDGEGELESPVTNYFYDAAGNLVSLVDPDGNTTSWVYDGLGRTVEETNELDATRYFEYDDAGNLIEETDRNDRVTEYVYDAIGRILEENWLDSQESVIWTIAYAYDSAGRLEGVGDDSAEYEYTYDDAARVLTETQTIAGLTPVIVLSYQYDANGRRTQVAATVGEDADFVTDYSYDYLGRVTRIEQYGVQGGSAVAEKRVDFTYDAAGQYDTITRYADLEGTDLVVTATYTYDLAGRLVSLTYTQGQTTLVDYDWTFDADDQITQYVNSIDGTADYTSDNTGQLTGADYDYQTDETYVYDENGNRVTANGDTYVTGDNNQLLSDGTYWYLYDDEGNRVARFVDADESGTLNTGDTDITTYAWDHRNRLTAVSDFATYADYTGEDPDQVVQYGYDYQNRLVRKVLDSDGDGDTDSSTVFSFVPSPSGRGQGEGIGQVALQFDKSGTGDASASDLSHRYLWGAAVDQILADEEVADLETAGDVLWPLVDHLNTTRDLATYDSQNDETTIANHRVFDAYGRLTDETNAAVDCVFGFTARMYDEDTGLQNNLNRWYDPAVGRWMSEDPLGIKPDANLYRYCGNVPTNETDPTGMFPPNRSIGGPPPTPVPGGVPGNDWVWHPDPGNSRGGTWGPRLPIPGQSQPSASWDPEGHWDVDNGLGDRQRYDQNGKPITPEEAHKPKPIVPPEAVKTVVVVGAGIGAGYIIYRCVRVVPSLFPPLWPTILPNLAIP